MCEREIIEKVASGLRRMKKSPDYLVLVEGIIDFNRQAVCGIPVLHTSQYVIYHPYSDSECPFIPCWKNEQDEDEGYDFARGYYEG